MALLSEAYDGFFGRTYFGDFQSNIVGAACAGNTNRNRTRVSIIKLESHYSFVDRSLVRK